MYANLKKHELMIFSVFISRDISTCDDEYFSASHHYIFFVNFTSISFLFMTVRILFSLIKFCSLYYTIIIKRNCERWEWFPFNFHSYLQLSIISTYSKQKNRVNGYICYITYSMLPMWYVTFYVANGNMVIW